MVLVGPSGCGKTTALRMVAGLEEITSGEIRIGGKVVNDLPPRDRDIAMVFQNYALYPHKNVYETSRSACACEGAEGRAEAARRGDRADPRARASCSSAAGAASGGQRQRVAMGRAIVREPKAFLMDEPLSNLDAKLRVQMRAEIARIQQALKVTTVYVTHDQVEAMTMGDRVAVMRDGELQQVDTPQRLYDAPANLFVASFVGSPPMNLFEAERRTGQRKRLVCRIGDSRAGASRRRRRRAAGPRGVRRPTRRDRDPAGRRARSSRLGRRTSPRSHPARRVPRLGTARPHRDRRERRSSAQTSSTRPPSPQAPPWVATTPSGGDAPRPFRPAPPPRAGRSGRGGDRSSTLALLRPGDRAAGSMVEVPGHGAGPGSRGLGVGAALVDGTLVPGDVEWSTGKIAASV